MTGDDATAPEKTGRSQGLATSPPTAPAAAEGWRFNREPFPRAAPLTGGVLDRADALRSNAEALAELAAHSAARVLPIWSGKPPIRLPDPADADAAPTLDWRDFDDPVVRRALSAIGTAGRPADPPVFLGLVADGPDAGAARFAVDVSDVDEGEIHALLAPAKPIDLRSIGAQLAAGEAATVALAKSLTDWHRTHRFCALCGGRSHSVDGGWRRDCEDCGARHFPRTDPVVIMLVVRRFDDGVERLVVGRQRNWPTGLYSLLAGYIEPGENVEEAVRRETQEEVGLPVGRVLYLASQPWPFPSTLMIGCWAEALAETLSPDMDELEDCRWIDKAEMAQALAGAHPTLMAPRADAIARMLVQAWVDDLFD